MKKNNETMVTVSPDRLKQELDVLINNVAG